ncbi:MAG: NAD(P)-dependent alcohol dehydrogenase, partial [Acidimicrobiia bacterium]|nr:NAD(P)-dependent alcohol dehydrogenase [Acidimicrobiia bacterium]
MARGEMEDQTKTSRIPATMKAIVQHRFGVANLELAEIPISKPEPNQVLVQVRASSINAFEWHMTSGVPYFMRLSQGLTKPKIPKVGADVAGTVAAVGGEVTRFKVGDRVFGDIGFGAYAEYAVSSERNLALKPESVGFDEAAAVPVAGLTALQGLRDVGNLQSGERVLIIGASGGVGTYAVQIAKVLGARVTAVCSTHNVETARSIGADVVIDYTREDFTRLDENYDLVFDGPGTTPLRKLRKLMKPEG